MELTIEKQKETPLLSRTRITAVVSFDGATPKRKEIRDNLAKKVGENADLVIVKHVYQHFGKKKARVVANVYQDRKILEQLEHKNLVKKHSDQPQKEEKKEEKKE